MKLPQVVFGYKRNTNGKRIVNEVEAEAVRLVFDLYIQGLDKYEIVGYLNKNDIQRNRPDVQSWVYYTVNKILSDNRYIGNEAFESIISKDIFDKALELNQNEKKKLETLNTRSFDPKRNYSLSGLIICGYCGNPYTRQAHSNTKVGNPNIWDCGFALKHGNDKCTMHFSINETVLYNLCIDTYNNILENNALLEPKHFNKKAIDTSKIDMDITKQISCLSEAVRNNDDESSEKINENINALLATRMKEVWSNTAFNASEFLTDRLLQYFEDNPQEMDDFDELKFRSVFKSIIALKPGELGFILRNEKQIKVNYVPQRRQEKSWQQKLQKLSK